VSVPSVVVTASDGTLEELPEALADLGVALHRRPLLSFAPPDSWDAVDQAVRRLADFSAVALTSRRAAAAFAQRVTSARAGRKSVAREVWATGAATARALGNEFGAVRLASQERVRREGAATALARAMLAAGVESTVLFPCGESRRDELPELLRAAGVEVQEAICYRSVLADERTAHAAAREADVLIVSSPSVAALLGRACPGEPRPDLLAVGVTTAAAAGEAGWPPAAVAEVPTAAALAAGVRALLHTR
jgi:uroporphyrinogen-III synthase